MRNPKRCVWSSSPDRGLQALLEMWPLIRAQVPDAELVVLYGFANWEGMAAQRGMTGELEFIGRLKAACGQPGVALRGRVSPRELAREFMSSGVWASPTWFSETACITAYQAQLAGLRIVTSPIAALVETVGDRGVLIPGAPQPIDMGRSFECSPCSEEFKTAFVGAVVKALTEPEVPGEREEQTRQARERFDLRTLCSDWSEMLTSLVASLELEIVPPFYCHPAFVEAARAADGEPEAA